MQADLFIQPVPYSQANEDIPFERVRQLKQTQQEKKAASQIDLQSMQQQDKQAISGRSVGKHAEQHEQGVVQAMHDGHGGRTHGDACKACTWQQSVCGGAVRGEAAVHCR